ncbi:hypothetical protein TWF103_011425 [Orbilia oligospora]|nr:hypothetical protein TWF103_011425 [Orbilia oligospora]
MSSLPIGSLPPELVERQVALLRQWISLGSSFRQKYVDDRGPLVEFEILVEILYVIITEIYQPIVYHRATRVVPPFYHHKYMELSCYPSDGLVEKRIVGLWAETQIFGGVLHFDRGETGQQICDIYLHPDNYEDNLYKIERKDIISLIERLLSTADDTITSNLQPSGPPISILDAQNQGIYRIKDLANSNLYNILPVALRASGFQHCHRNATEEPSYAPPTAAQQEYKGILMTDDLARKIASIWMDVYGSSEM